MLELNNFSNQFIENANFSAKRGEITAIIGPNGSGKTTLAKYISGIYDDYEGEIKLNGEVICEINDGVALLLQNPYHQFVGLDIFDELTYNLEQNFVQHQQIKEVLEHSPINVERQLMSLSGGEAQQILIYNYLQSDKEVFIFDETFSNLDAKLKTEIFDLIKAQNKVIILITNNIFDLNFADVTYQIIDKQLRVEQVVMPSGALLSNENNVTIDVNDGQYQFKKGLNLLLGASGSGKSTLVKDLCGITKRKVKTATNSQDFYFISQYPFVQITNLKVKELINKTLKSEQLLTELGFMPIIFERDIVSLSTGELVQVMFVHSLISHKKNIVLDESIEVLDYKKQQLILDICEEYSELTFIFVTHNLQIYLNRKVNEVMINA